MTKVHVKVFSGESIMVNRLSFLLDEANIPSLIKDNVNSASVAGFGALGNSIELFIYNTDLEKANLIIEKFQKEIAE